MRSASITSQVQQCLDVRGSLSHQLIVYYLQRLNDRRTKVHFRTQFKCILHTSYTFLPSNLPTVHIPTSQIPSSTPHYYLYLAKVGHPKNFPYFLLSASLPFRLRLLHPYIHISRCPCTDLRLRPFRPPPAISTSWNRGCITHFWRFHAL